MSDTTAIQDTLLGNDDEMDAVDAGSKIGMLNQPSNFCSTLTTNSEKIYKVI
jgi:hypothetical protein